MKLKFFRLFWSVWILLVCVSMKLPAQVIISEFMASNSSTLRDEDGDSSDWIEIFNTSSGTVNLSGWALTDDPGTPKLWIFPNVNLPAKGFLVVFASAKDRRVVGANLHTNFKLDGAGEYLALVRPDSTVASQFSPQFPEQYTDISYGIGQSAVTNTLLAARAAARVLVPADGSLGSSWTQIGFNDSSWTSGLTGVGYETAVPGFAVRNIKANVTVGTLAAAEGVVANPSQQSRIVSENAAVINYFGTGADGHYGNNGVFPGATVGVDVDDFVVEATATVTIPVAGNWTFGVNSDDGFGLTIGSFSMSFPDPRSPGDTVSTFNFPSAGDYNLRLVFYERGGGSCVELFAAQGSFAGWDATSFRLVGDTANGGLSVKSLPVSGGGGGSYRSLIGTDIVAQMKGRNATAYIRVPFTASNPASLQSLTLRIKYDDGLIAYLNGQEVARRNAPTTAQWNSAATAPHPNDQALAYEEINLTDRIGLLQNGNNVLAIQGLNENSNDSDFLILPELVEYQGSLLTNHYFSTPSPNAINGTGFYAFVADTKFSQDRGFYDTPFTLTISTETPGATIRYTTDGTPPTLSNGITYTGPIAISRTTVIRAAAFKSGYEPSNVDTQTYLFLDDVIRQSPTGTAPPGWPSSWGGNTVDYGMDPNVVNDPAYSGTIKNDLKTIPSFSIVMNLNDLFNATTGIYANPGQDGIDWERPTSVELIYPDGAKGFQINAGIRIRGGFSRSTGNPKHAFRLFFRQEYGAAKLKYPLFDDNGTDTFDAIDLRTFQNYSWSFQGDGRGVFLRDQFSRDAQLAMGQQGERGKFYHLYINGQYWGLYNTCERPEASFSETYYGGNKDDYDVVKVSDGYNIFATDGNLSAWSRLWQAATNGLASNAAYFKVQGLNPDGTPNAAYENLLDVDNLIDYMLIILYGGNLDAPISNFLGNDSPNNWYGVRDRTGQRGGFRFFAHDAEHTLLDVNSDRTGIVDGQIGQINPDWTAGNPLTQTPSVAFTKSSPQYVWFRLQQNAEFRLRVADRVHRYFFNNGLLTPQTARALFLTRKNEIDRAVVGESARWGDAKREPAFTRNDWVNAINTVLNGFLPGRSGVMLNQLRADGLYPTITAPSFNQQGGNVNAGFALTMTAPAGTIYYTRDGTDPRLLGGAVAPTALVYSSPVALNQSVQIKSRVLSGGVWSALNEATFYIIQTSANLLLTEIMYNPPASGTNDGDSFEFIELKNVAATALELSGAHFTNGINYMFPLGTFVQPGQFIVLVSDPAAFAAKYPGVRVDGVYTGRLSNGGERITLIHASGSLIFSVTYGDAIPWPIATDGTGFSIVPVNPNLNPDPSNAANWRASTRLGGSPGADDPPSTVSVVWINEVLTHTDPPQLDAIELYNPNPFDVDISNWYLTDNRAVSQKFRIPVGPPIPAGGYRVFTEADFNANPVSPTSFLLDSHGEEVYLFSADASGNLTGFSDGFSFGAAANGVTFGRYTTSIGDIQYPAQQANSLGSANAGPRIGPVVFNEILYHPALGFDEFIELKNITGGSIKLYDTNGTPWRINGIDFYFPPNTEIPANGLLVVTGSDPNYFRNRYSVPTGVQIFGPFPGVLQDNGELLELQRPDAPDVDTNGVVIIPYITVDAVRYNDQAPWPLSAAGGGSSLERINASAYGNDPVNWRASFGVPSPGLENSGNRAPLVNAGADQTVQATSFPVVGNLSGTVTDDGLPNPPGSTAVTWSKTSGPGTVTFGNPNQLNTTATFSSIGTYVLRLMANDGELQANAEVTFVIQRSASPVTLVPKNSVWKYLDNGSDAGTAWRQSGFNDGLWKSGPGTLGYGDPTVQRTIVNSGPSGSFYTTTYFRRAFTVTNAADVIQLTVSLLRDDGGVVYLNGTEVFRSNMPIGGINYLTRASNTIGGADETTFYPMIVDPTLLVNGANVLAVEIHQVNLTSTDVSFDLELTGMVYPPNQRPTVNAGPDQTLTAPADATLHGTVTDDGLPTTPGQVAVSWSKMSGPGAVTFDDANAADTIAHLTVPGIYVLRLTANDGALAATDDVTITVNGDSFDTWRAQYFTAAELANPAISGPDADPDADGFTNNQEYQSGTNPRDPQSYLKIESPQLVGGAGDQFRIRFNAAAGKSYSIQYQTSMSGSAWLNLTNIAAEATTRVIEVLDVTGGGGAGRYYRLVTPQQ